MTPYYSHAGITIYHGDCREVLPTLEYADLLLADPPYNVDLEYLGRSDSLLPEEYEAWSREWFEIARPKARKAFVFTGTGNLRMWLRLYKPAGLGCWHKPGNSRSSVLGFEEWEPFIYFHGGNHGFLGGSSVITARTKDQNTGHPCPKPPALISTLIKKARASSVIDPFLGSGTTVVAAREIGVEAIGIEIEEKYCEIAAKRLSQEVLPFQNI